MELGLNVWGRAQKCRDLDSISWDSVGGERKRPSKRETRGNETYTIGKTVNRKPGRQEILACQKSGPRGV